MYATFEVKFAFISNSFNSYNYPLRQKKIHFTEETYSERLGDFFEVTQLVVSKT